VEPKSPSPFETIKDPPPHPSGTGLTTALTASVTHVLEEKLEEWPSSAVYSKATRLVLIQIEAKRAAGWSLMIGAMSLIACALLAFVSMPRDLKGGTLFALGSLGAVSAWVYSQSRDPKRYSRLVFRVFGWVSATASMMLAYALGVFSPMPVATNLGISFFGLSNDRLHSKLICLYSIVGYLIMTLLVTIGVIEDRGLFRAPPGALEAKIFMLVMVPTVLVVGFWLSRLSAITMEEAIEKSTRAMRLAAQKRAQLAEAQQDLQRVLIQGKGQAGKFSGQMVGSYSLGKLIGRGAMGEIYIAYHQTTKEQAAVKLLMLDHAERETSIARFHREGAQLMKLDSPHIVRVFNYGDLEGVQPYIIMEYLRGRDLASILRDSPKLRFIETVEMVTDVAKGLEVAHSAGVVHRDLKPQNIFRCDGDHRWKILDFGVCTLVGEGSSLTRDMVVGTPGYMAPEQAKASALDYRADIFSLASLCYRALTGRPPFSGDDIPQIMYKIVYNHPVRPSDIVQEIPRDAERVLLLGLAKSPAHRFRSATAFATALKDAFQGTLREDIRRRADELHHRQGWSVDGGEI